MAGCGGSAGHSKERYRRKLVRHGGERGKKEGDKQKVKGKHVNSHN
jgi:hypothetical protein